MKTKDQKLGEWAEHLLGIKESPELRNRGIISFSERQSIISKQRSDYTHSLNTLSIVILGLCCFIVIVFLVVFLK